MRKAITLLLITIAFISNAQESKIPTNEKTGFAEYTDVVTQTGSASTLYDQAMQWIDSYFKNPSGTIKEKKEGEIIKGQSRFKVVLRDKKDNVIRQSYVNYDFQIDFKDGKYRYMIDRINWQKPSYYDVSKWENTDDSGYQKDVYPLYVNQTVEFFEAFLDAMGEGIATPIEVETTDW